MEDEDIITLVDMGKKEWKCRKDELWMSQTLVDLMKDGKKMHIVTNVLRNKLATGIVPLENIRGTVLEKVCHLAQLAQD